MPAVGGIEKAAASHSASPDLSPTTGALRIGGLGSSGALGVGLGGHNSAGLLGLGGGNGPSTSLRDSMRDLSISQPATVSRGTSRRSLGGLGSAGGTAPPPIGTPSRFGSVGGGGGGGGLFGDSGLFPANFTPSRHSPSPPNPSQLHNHHNAHTVHTSAATAPRGHARSHPHVHSSVQGHPSHIGPRVNPGPISRPSPSISPGLRPIGPASGNHSHTHSQHSLPHAIGTNVSVSSNVSQVTRVDHSPFPPVLSSSTSTRRVSPVLNPFGVGGVPSPSVPVGNASAHKIVGGPTKASGIGVGIGVGVGSSRVTHNGVGVGGVGEIPMIAPNGQRCVVFFFFFVSNLNL